MPILRVASEACRTRNTWQIEIASSYIAVPAKHRVDGLIVVLFVRVHPEVLYAITCCLFPTEFDLVIASLALPGPFRQASERNLLHIRPPLCGSMA